MPETLAPPSPAQTGSAVPASRGVIHVGADGGLGGPASSPKPASAAPTTPAKPTARESMEKALAEKIKPGTSIDYTPEKPLGSQPGKAPEQPTEPAGSEEPPTGSEPPPAKDTTADPNAPKPKVNPWKLMEEHKTRAAKLESEIVELKKLVPNEAARKSEIQELEQTRARAKELEDEIRYVNYSKSPEFKEKYEKPYQQAWSKAMADLKEISVEDPSTGESRQVTANDMLNLVNLPLGKARELADAAFGNFADDVMAHRKEIKNLFESQAQALDDARSKGAEREKQMLEQHQAGWKTLENQASEIWTKANESATKDESIGKYLSPIEGNQDHNQRLAKGQEMVDRAFKENPMDRKLSPDDRAAIIKRHAAVRNRAIAYGPLLHENRKLQARLAEVEKELGQFKGSTPGTTGTTTTKVTAPALSAREQMFENLGKLVKNR